MPSLSTAAPTADDARSPAAFERLLAAHRGILLKVAASYAFDRDERADLVQDIALQLWRAWPGYDAARPFPTWMYRIALNVAISHRRSARLRPPHEDIADAHEHLPGARDVEADGRDELATVQRAMRALAPLDRALLLLHLEGCSHREAGEVLGLSETNAATRLGRVRQQLRRVAGADTGER